MNKKYIMLLVLICGKTAYARISFVYNLRIAETTKSKNFEKEFYKPWITSATAVGQFRQRRNDTRQYIGGGLGTCIYSPASWYVRADFAVARVKQTGPLEAQQQARTQTDDLLLSGGYGFGVGKRTKFSFSGLLGIPTHKDKGLSFVQFGTGHVGMGVQVDGSFNYHKTNTIRTAARYIHFFGGRTNLIVNDAIEFFDYKFGNINDFYIAHQTVIKRQHRIEFGYNPSFFYGAKIEPDVPEVNNEFTYIRSNFFATYKYYFLLNKFPSGVIVGISSGFDHIPKRTGLKNIVTVWAAWGINF